MRTNRVFPLLAVLAAAAWADRIPPGGEGQIQVPGSQHASLLYVPSDWKEGMKYPLILFMHGAGGKPTTWPFRDTTKGSGYLIVGLAYGGQDDAAAQGIRQDASTVSAMMKYIDDVRALVDKEYGVDPSQVFLTGLSMGGWGVNFYGFHADARGKYRGYCIIAAGPLEEQGVDLSVAKGLPLLLVNGEQDQNLQAAQRGKPAAEKAGAIVELKVIPGEGHVPSVAKLSEAIAPWLAANGPQKELLALVEKAKGLEATKPGEALSLYEKAAQSPSTDPIVAEARAKAEAIRAEATKVVEAAEALATAGRLVEAAKALDAVAAKYAGADLAKSAAERADAIRKGGDFAKATREAAADAALAKADALAEARKYDEAVRAYQQVVASWPDTDAAKSAQARGEALAQDPEAQASIQEKQAASRLGMAKNFLANGSKDRAIPILDEILEKYPGTKAAAEAKKLKDSLR